jgi:polysaccharide export outer membrane protein
MTGLELILNSVCRWAQKLPISKGMALLLAAGMCISPYGCATSDNAQVAEKLSASEISAEPSVVKFILGPGDEVSVRVWRNEDLNVAQQITPSGYLYYPMIGDIKAAGLSIMELRDAVTEGLSRYLVNPQVIMNVESSVSQKVFVLGEVNRPGVFPLVGPMSTIEAISAAQGFTLDAAPNSVVLIRGGGEKPQLAVLNVKSVIQKGNLTENVMLRGGDIIYVPSSTIADVERFFQRLRVVLRTIVTLENGIILYPLVEDALNGETTRAVISTGD